MKSFRFKISPTFLISISVLGYVGYFIGCTQKDQVLNVGGPPTTNELLSLKTSTAPAIDGTIDASWSVCQKLTTTVSVPDPGNDYFKGYVGNEHTVSLRSQYD